MPNTAKHYQPAPIAPSEKAPAPAAQQGLSFAFSTSEDKATGAFFNRARAVGLMRLSATGSNFIGDYLQRNSGNKAAAVMGLWGNATYFLFGNNKNPVLGQLAITHGQWDRHGDYFEQVIPQTIPKESINRICHLIEDGAQPKDALSVETHPDRSETIVRIRADLFDKTQDAMKASLERRAKAFEFMSDANRHVLAKDVTDTMLLSGIKLNDVPDDIAKEIYEIVRNEWQIRTRIAGNTPENRHLEVHSMQQAEFDERMNRTEITKTENLLVKRDSRTTHAPGFFKILFQPHKYPVEHSVLVGGLGANVLRNAGAIEMASRPKVSADGKQQEVRLKEFVSNTMNIVSYLVELQPETSQHTRGDWEKTGDERQFFTRDSKSWGQDFLDITDERPMLAGALIRPTSMAIKAWGQVGEAMRNQKKVIDGNDINENHMLGQKFRIAATGIDVATLIASGGLKKADFGR